MLVAQAAVARVCIAWETTYSNLPMSYAYLYVYTYIVSVYIYMYMYICDVLVRSPMSAYKVFQMHELVTSLSCPVADVGRAGSRRQGGEAHLKPWLCSRTAEFILACLFRVYRV